MVKSRSNIAEFSSDLRKDALYMMEKVEENGLNLEFADPSL
jgi:hypothetical protein